MGDNGEEIEFNSMVDAANYMSEKDGTFNKHILLSIPVMQFTTGYSTRKLILGKKQGKGL